MGYCKVCTEAFKDPEAVEHFRVYHPDDMPLLWPDGEAVIDDFDIEQ